MLCSRRLITSASAPLAAGAASGTVTGASRASRRGCRRGSRHGARLVGGGGEMGDAVAHACCGGGRAIGGIDTIAAADDIFIPDPRLGRPACFAAFRRRLVVLAVAAVLAVVPGAALVPASGRGRLRVSCRSRTSSAHIRALCSQLSPPAVASSCTQCRSAARRVHDGDDARGPPRCTWRAVDLDGVTWL